MNIEDWLREDARREAGNPLEARVGGLVQRVRRQRRRRAATGAAGVVTVVAAGVLVWQVGGTPWDRQAPPPANPPGPQWCGQTVDELAGSVAHPDMGEVQLGSAGGELAVDATLTSAEGAELSPWLDVLVTDPDTGQVLALSEQDRSADRSVLDVPADGETQVGRSLTLTWCTSAFTGQAEAYLGDFTGEHAGEGATWLTGPATVEFTDGALGTPDDQSTGEEETTAPEDGSQDADEREESASPDPGTEISAPESYEPTCGQAWDPPTNDTGWAISGEFGPGPHQASPDGATGGLRTELTLTNTSTQDLTAQTYTQAVLVADGQVVSPAVLGSDHVVETSLAPGEETTQSGGHHLWDYCETDWTGVGPSVPAGEYTVYVMVLDAQAYWDNSERAVLAVTDGETIEVTAP